MLTTIAEMSAACDTLAARMAEKGILRPKAEANIQSGAGLRFTLYLGEAWNTYGHEYKFFPTITKAEEWVAALPTPDERHRAEFLKLAAAAADYAAAHLPADEIAGEVRASIVAAMTKLSENAIAASKED